jgi:hypothetical protein
LKPAFAVFPRKDFKGGRASISQIGLGLGIHSLLAHAYRDAFPMFENQHARAAASSISQAVAGGIPYASGADVRADDDADGAADGAQPDDDDGGADIGDLVEPGDGDAAEEAGQGLAIDGQLVGSREVAGDPSDWRTQEATNRQLGRDFILSTHTLEDCFLNAILLGSEERLMSEVMRMSGNTWDVQQLVNTSKGQPRDYKICVLREGKFFNQYALEMHTHWNDPAMWSWMLATPTRASRIFRAVSRSMATSYENCKVRYRRWPMPFFDLAKDPASIEQVMDEIEATPTCVLDPYVEELVRHYSKTPSGLRGPDVLLEASAIAIDADPITLSTERVHSRARKRIKERSQTKKASLAFVTSYEALRARSSIRGLMQAARRKQEFKDEARQKPAARRPSRSKRKAWGKEAEAVLKKPAASGESQGPQRSGGGGRYRAFFSALGQRGELAHCATAVERYREVARRWSVLTEVEKAAYNDVGHAGTLRHRRGETNSFHVDRRVVYSTSALKHAASRLRAIADSRQSASAPHGTGHSFDIVPISSSVLAVRPSDMIDEEMKQEVCRLRFKRRAEVVAAAEALTTLVQFGATESSQAQVATVDVGHPSVGSSGCKYLCFKLVQPRLDVPRSPLLRKHRLQNQCLMMFFASSPQIAKNEPPHNSVMSDL